MAVAAGRSVEQRDSDRPRPLGYSGPRWSSLQPAEEDEIDLTATVIRRAPWNKGTVVGEKAPFKVKDIWAIRVRLQIQMRTRDLFDLGIDSKLRGCDLVKLRVP